MNFRIDKGHKNLRAKFKAAFCEAEARNKDKPLQLSLTYAESERTLEQNDKMWAMLGDIAKQVEWFGRKHDKECWKDIITAHLNGQEMVQGIDGKLVVRGQSTRKMSIAAMGDVIECCYWFGADHGVIWTDPRAKAAAEWAEQEARRKAA